MKTKVAILGAGITGILTAYFLNKSGYDVIIIEKRSGVGLGASLANGSQISFSHIVPSFFEKKTSIFSKETIESKVNKKENEVKEFLIKQKNELLNEEKNIQSLAKISEISHHSLEQIIKAEELERYFKPCGILHFFEDEKNLTNFANKAMHFGQKFRILNKQEALELEPNIANFESKIIGGLHFENDKTSNCHDLCKIFEKMLKERGVNFVFNQDITSFQSSNTEVISAISETGEEFKADYFILCNGTEVPKTAQALGLNFDIFPVRGYSYTFNMEQSHYPPFIGLIDRKNRIVYSLYKTYLRVAGFFDLGINDPLEISNRMKDFEETIFASFPLLRRNGIAHKWTENRPFTPSSVPIIGRTKEFHNLLINAGHGSLGLTLSFGAGKIIEEII